MTSKSSGLFIALVTLFSLLSTVAHATPGDVSCIADTPSKQKLEVLLGYDTHDQLSASFIEVILDGKSLVTFPSSVITAGYEDVGTEKLPFMNYHQWAKDGTNQITLRYPEQDPSVAHVTIYVTVEIPKTATSAGLSLKELEIGCY